jgi:hypothetical protein
MRFFKSDQSRKGFCVFVDTVGDGPQPAVWGDHAPVVYDTEHATEHEAQREIADHQILRLQQFLEGEREFEDAIVIQEYVVPVRVVPGGRILHSPAVVSGGAGG